MKIITRSFSVFTVLLFAGMIYVYKFDTSFDVKNSQKNIQNFYKLSSLNTIFKNVKLSCCHLIRYLAAFFKYFQVKDA